jgi:hypothetical protein
MPIVAAARARAIDRQHTRIGSSRQPRRRRDVGWGFQQPQDITQLVLLNPTFVYMYISEIDARS